jgi:hypothetical protein
VEIADGLGIKPVSRVTARMKYGESVAAAAEVSGWGRHQARARWREASGFAHGRTWPMLRLTSPTNAEVIRGGYGLTLALDEQRLSELARLSLDVLGTAIDWYGRLSNDGPD